MPITVDKITADTITMNTVFRVVPGIDLGINPTETPQPFTLSIWLSFISCWNFNSPGYRSEGSENSYKIPIQRLVETCNNHTTCNLHLLQHSYRNIRSDTHDTTCSKLNKWLEGDLDPSKCRQGMGIELKAVSFVTELGDGHPKLELSLRTADHRHRLMVSLGSDFLGKTADDSTSHLAIILIGLIYSSQSFNTRIIHTKS
ncbi:hypothetical protein BDB01DRAFT_893002 [Pilobolus umbonatus]|nr:hypothetical protein BDB01DRAFT_893002 [Pilobolus umbonatus]